MDLLVTSAAVLSILMGEAMAALVVMWLVNFSEWLETRTVEKTRKAIRDMLQQETRDTWVVREGVEVQIAVSDLVKGDVVSIRQGDAVPADGTVTDGEALINEAAMSGESRPVFKVVGDIVLAGTTVEMGKLLVQVGIRRRRDPAGANHPPHRRRPGTESRDHPFLAAFQRCGCSFFSRIIAPYLFPHRQCSESDVYADHRVSMRGQSLNADRAQRSHGHCRTPGKPHQRREISGGSPDGSST